MTLPPGEVLEDSHFSGVRGVLPRWSFGLVEAGVDGVGWSDHGSP